MDLSILQVEIGAKQYDKESFFEPPNARKSGKMDLSSVLLRSTINYEPMTSCKSTAKIDPGHRPIWVSLDVIIPS